MNPSLPAIEALRSDVSSALSTHFRALAAAAGTSVDLRRLRAHWEPGLFVAGLATERHAGQYDDPTVGLLHLATPRDLPLATQVGQEVPPGNYALLVPRDGSVSLRSLADRTSIQLSPPDFVQRVPGSEFVIASCGDGDPLDLDLDYKNCRICFTLECPGRWVLLLGCLTVPLCDLVIGAVGPS